MTLIKSISGIRGTIGGGAGNMAVSGNIPSGNVNTGNQFQMIDSEACDLFHNQIHPFVSFAVCCCTQVGIFRIENSVQYRGRCHLTVSTFIIKGIPCGYKMEFVNCQCLFSRSAPFNCQFILVSHSDLYYNNG